MPLRFIRIFAYEFRETIHIPRWEAAGGGSNPRTAPLVSLQIRLGA
jgi:hypothetical protein